MLVNGLPCLDYPGKEDSSANICACELFMGIKLVNGIRKCAKLKLTLHKMTEENPCHQLHQQFLFCSPNDPIRKQIPGPNVL
jgi:hypothetical protein